MTSPVLIKAIEASKLIRATDDPALRLTLARATTIAVMKFHESSGQCIRADFDMQFFVEVLLELFADKEMMRRTLNGEPPDIWWDDPDS